MKKSIILLALCLALTVGLSAFDFVGTWDLYYDWGCNNTYASTEITINSDGTFTWDSSTAGYWYEEDGCKIIFQFDGGTTYAGTKVGRAMLGMMGLTDGTTVNGCWYAVRQISGIPSADANPRDASGAQIGIGHKD